MNLQLQNFDAVIFDMDGLLIDTEQLGFRMWTKACAEFGYALTLETFQLLMGRSRTDNQAILLAELGEDFPFEQVRKRRVELGREEIFRNGIAKRPGADEALAFFRSAGKKIALATSTERDIALERLKLANLSFAFDASVTGDEVPQSKPDPAIFLLALERLEVQSHRAIVLEDSNPGIEAAQRAQIPALMVVDLAQPTDPSRAYASIFPSLLEVINSIQSD